MAHAALSKSQPAQDSKRETVALEDHSANVAHLSPCHNPSEGFGTFDLNILVDYGEDALRNPARLEKSPRQNAYWVQRCTFGL